MSGIVAEAKKLRRKRNALERNVYLSPLPSALKKILEDRERADNKGIALIMTETPSIFSLLVFLLHSDL